jgi:hypothetical protein
MTPTCEAEQLSALPSTAALVHVDHFQPGFAVTRRRPGASWNITISTAAVSCGVMRLSGCWKDFFSRGPQEDDDMVFLDVVVEDLYAQ